MTRTIVIDRQLRGVGRICLATGTSNPVVAKKYDRMLDALKDDGRVDILRAIRDRILTFAEAYDAYRRGALGELATGETAKPLAKAWGAWVSALNVPDDCSEKHKVSLITSGRYFQRADGKARVGDLPRLLRKLRETLGAKHPRSFNLARSAASAFVRDTLTRAHPLYTQVTAVETRTVKRKRKGRPLSPEQMANYFPFPPRDAVDEIAWGMATTGMGQSEFWGAWWIATGLLHIEGTKRDGRVRDVPLFFHPSKPRIHHRTFEDKLRERTGRAIQPYDLRRTFAHWMEMAGIPRSRRRIYMGHGTSSVTDLYEHHEVRRFLQEDAAKLAALLPPTPVESPVILPIKRKGA